MAIYNKPILHYMGKTQAISTNTRSETKVCPVSLLSLGILLEVFAITVKQEDKM